MPNNYPSPNKKGPTVSHCGVPSKWVDMGPRLRYWYCEKCKTEVSAGQALSSKTDFDVDLNGLGSLTQEQLDALLSVPLDTYTKYTADDETDPWGYVWGGD